MTTNTLKKSNLGRARWSSLPCAQLFIGWEAKLEKLDVFWAECV